MVHIFPRLQVTGKIGAVGATVGAAAPWWQGANMPHGFLSNPGSPASIFSHFFFRLSVFFEHLEDPPHI